MIKILAVAGKEIKPQIINDVETVELDCLMIEREIRQCSKYGAIYPHKAWKFPHRKKLSMTTLSYR